MDASLGFLRERSSKNIENNNHSRITYRNDDIARLDEVTLHLTISMHGQRATGRIPRNNYHHGSCRPSLTGKTSSVSLIFTQGTHRNVKNR